MKFVDKQPFRHLSVRKTSDVWRCCICFVACIDRIAAIGLSVIVLKWVGRMGRLQWAAENVGRAKGQGGRGAYFLRQGAIWTDFWRAGCCAPLIMPS
jgi:hypothetical protein